MLVVPSLVPVGVTVAEAPVEVGVPFAATVTSVSSSELNTIFSMFSPVTSMSAVASDASAEMGSVTNVMRMGSLPSVQTMFSQFHSPLFQ